MPTAIITPAWNAERFIARTLESVLAQTYGDWQHIIVDDGSTDSTARIVKSFAERDSRFRLISQPNSGVSAARNAGYAALPVDCDYVLFLDADDLMSPKSLQLLTEALQANPNVPAAHGRSECIDANDTRIPHVTRERLGRRVLRDSGALLSSPADVIVLPDSFPTSFAALAFTNPISTPGQVLLRRRAVDQVGLFDSGANLAEDWDLYLRVAQSGPFAYVPDVLLLYRQHASNASAHFGKMRRAELYVRHKVIASSRLALPLAPGCGISSFNVAPSV
jgi:glycosyltransferase involved in cell wall biosynthesis